MSTVHTNKVRSLPAKHVIATLMREHDHVLKQLDELERLVAQAPRGIHAIEELVGIEAIAQSLIALEPHHQREERVLFPALRQRGVQGPPSVMEQEHVHMRELKHALLDKSTKMLETGESLWEDVERLSGALAQELREHIYKENEVLYPLALERIPDDVIWEQLRVECDAIGYCCGAGQGSE
jgi:DUF438 domain-containing protein